MCNLGPKFTLSPQPAERSDCAPGSIDVPPTWSMLSIGFIDDGLTQGAEKVIKNIYERPESQEIS